MKKRVLSMLLACTLVIGMLAGCGSSSSSSSSSTSTTTETADTGSDETAAAEETEEIPTEVGGVYLGDNAGQATSVTYWMDPQNMSANTVNSFNDEVAWQTYEANLGIDIVWEEPASGQASEQFSLIIATDDLPDIMYYSWPTAYPGGPDQAIEDGKIIPLQDLIEEYAPNFYAYLEAHPDVRQEITTDSGNIYCFPGIYTYTSEDSDVWQDAIDREPYEEKFMGLVIRTDLLDEVGMDIPVTLEDWYNVLTAFKEIGIEYPLSVLAYFLTGSQAFNSAFDITVPMIGMSMGGTSEFVVDDETGEIIYGPAQDSYQDYLIFMNTLYEEGLLDPDFMVQERETMDAKIINGQVGAWIGMMPTELGNIRATVLEADPDSTWYAVGVTSPVLYEGQQLKYQGGNSFYISAGAAITTSCEDVITAMKVLDYGWSEEGNRILNWGIEGVSYEFVDGWPALTDQIINNPEGDLPSVAFSLYRNLNGPYPMDHSQRLVSKIDYSLGEDEVDENIEALETWTSSANGLKAAGLPATTLTTEESTAYASAYSDLSTYVEEMYARFVMGTESLDDENFQKYQDTLETLGLSTVLEIQTAALERYNARVE